MATQDAETPPSVAQHATEQARLPRTALLGLFGTPTAPRALIRLPRGQTQIVSVGDRVAGGTVDAIAEDRLVLTRMGNQHVLRMPEG